MMFEPSTDLCRGSYLLGESVALGGADRSDGGANTGTCPVCGRSLALGYALLLPAHKRVRISETKAAVAFGPG